MIDDWSIEKTCDTVTLESSHPFKHPDYKNQLVSYTHECKDDEIAYFKVDVNLISSLPDTYLGNVWKTYNSLILHGQFGFALFLQFVSRLEFSLILINIT